MVLPDMQVMMTRDYLLLLRDGLLKQVDAVERMLNITPRTSEIRKMIKSESDIIDIAKQIETKS